MQYQSFITSVLEAAAQVATTQFGKVSGQTKPGDNNQVLTVTDQEIGQLIIGRIQATYPDHNIIDEEAGVIDKSSEFTWVVDPIDGTSNFANSVPLYGTMVGLLKGGQPVAGGLSLPEFDEIYTAEIGQGCWLGKTPLKLATDRPLTSSLVAYGIDGHPEHPLQTHAECDQLAAIVLSCRNLRTSNSVFDVAMLLKNGYGAILNQTSKIWDNVAQQIVVTEAGGLYTDIHGQAMDYSEPLTRAEQNFDYCAAAPNVHQELQAILHRA